MQRLAYPDRITDKAEDADATKVDVERLTRIYTAPQACTGRGGACLHNSDCCPGLHCVGAVPVHFIFGTCVS